MSQTNNRLHPTFVGIDVSMAKLDVAITDDPRHRIYAYDDRGIRQLAKDLATLTPQQFWLTIAKQGGYLVRKRDPRPGWKVLWRGWYDIQQMVR